MIKKNIVTEKKMKFKYEYLIKQEESVTERHFDNLSAFIEYLNDASDVGKNIEDLNPRKDQKMLLVFVSC